MAVKKNAECEIIIKVETGATSTGKASYSSRSFGYINPLPKIYKNIKICLFPSSLNPILP